MNQKELLKGLEGKGIVLNTRSLARFTADNGVLCELHCGRKRGHFSLPTKLMGLRVDKWNEQNREFFDQHIKMGSLAMIPPEMEKKLNHLDAQVRYLLADYSINGSYVPLAVFGEFKEKFDEIREDYLKTIDEVAQNWDEIRENFINGATALVEARGKRTILKRDREAIIKNLKASIPSAADYRSSAYMGLDVRAFPTTGVTTEGLAPDLQDCLNQTWRDDVVSNAIKAIETTLGQIFVQTCSTAKVFVKAGKMDTRSVNTLEKVAARVKKMNIFANPILDELGTRLSNLSNLSDDEINTEVEEAILDVVEYAKKTGVNLDMKKCPFTEEQLDNMLKLRQTMKQTA